MVGDVLCIHYQLTATSIELSTAAEYCQDSYNISEHNESDNTNVRYRLALLLSELLNWPELSML